MLPATDRDHCPSPPLTAAMRTALELLEEAHGYGQRSGEPPREFAVDLPDLAGHGVSYAALRWLLQQGYVEHLVETTASRASRCTFRAAANRSFSPRSCFLLTHSGLALASHARAGGLEDHPAAPEWGNGRPGKQGRDPEWRPEWDARERVLRYRGLVVKRFRRPAPNQEKSCECSRRRAGPRAS